MSEMIDNRGIALDNTFRIQVAPKSCIRDGAVFKGH
jgi:hypothetical protein